MRCVLTLLHRIRHVLTDLITVEAILDAILYLLLEHSILWILLHDTSSFSKKLGDPNQFFGILYTLHRKDSCRSHPARSTS